MDIERSQVCISRVTVWRLFHVSTIHNEKWRTKLFGSPVKLYIGIDIFKQKFRYKICLTADPVCIRPSVRYHMLLNVVTTFDCHDVWHWPSRHVIDVVEETAKDRPMLPILTSQCRISITLHSSSATEAILALPAASATDPATCYTNSGEQRQHQQGTSRNGQGQGQQQ